MLRKIKVWLLFHGPLVWIASLGSCINNAKMRIIFGDQDSE